MRFIDTHCHLYSTEFDQDRGEMIRKAIDAGVHQMMLPNIDLDSIAPMMDLVEKFPGHCYPMIGLHPVAVKNNYQELLDEMKVRKKSGIYSGIGETGVDLYWDTTYKEYQIDAFGQQITWAQEMELPVIIHSRESLDLNIGIIQNQQDGKLKGIFHCFSGNYEQAIKIFELGFKIGIGGVVTFKKSGLDQLLPRLPPEMIVLETDAPYLAPTPFRGKRNESAYLVIIAEKVAQSLGISLFEVEQLTSSNAHDVFGKKD